MAYEATIRPPSIPPLCGNMLSPPAQRLHNRFYKRSANGVVLYLFTTLFCLKYHRILRCFALTTAILALSALSVRAQYPVVGGTATSTSGLVFTHQVNLPSGIQPGDLLLVFWADASTFTNINNLPAGWTVLYNINPNNYRRLALYRIADGTEGSFITIITSLSERSAHNSYRIEAGTYIGTPVATDPLATGFSRFPDPPELTSGFGEVQTLWLAVAHCSGDNNTPPPFLPSNYSNLVTAWTGSAGSTHARMATARREWIAATEDPGNFTLGFNVMWGASTVAIEGACIDATLTLTSAAGTDNQTVCLNEPIIDITYGVGGSAIGAGVSGLPAGVAGNYSAGVFTISGTPSETGTFNYTVTTTGTPAPCSDTSINGTIVVNPLPSCSINGPGEPVCPNSTNSYTGPAGLSYSWAISGNGSISGSSASQTVSVVAGSLCNSTFTLELITTDANGCSSTCNRTVNVDDLTDPVLACPGPLTAVCSIAEQPAYTTLAAFEAAGGSATDNCGIDASSFTLLSEVSDNNSCPEVVTRTYRIADLCGNTATCTQTITIDDNIDPVLNCPGSLTAVCSIAEQPAYTTLAAFEAAGGTATDNCGIDAGSFTLLSEVSDDNSCPEVITRTYQVTDLCGNTATCTQAITIDDNIDPVLTCPGPLTAVCSIAEQPAYTTLDAFEAAGGTATDNCGIDAGSFTLLSEVSDNNSCPEVVTRTYRIADLCGNTATCTQTITINDDIDPVLACPGPLTAVCSIAEQPAYTTLAAFEAAGGSATDNCGIDASSFTLLSEVSDNNSCPEVVTRTYQIADLCGNTSTCTQTITIDDGIDPVLTCPEPLTAVCSIAEQPAYATLAEFEAAGGIATDNCGIDASSLTLISEVSDNNTCPEVITRTYQIADLCGNTATCTQAITIDDDIDPVLTCPAPLTAVCSIAEQPAYATLAAFETAGGTATDNCGIDAGSFTLISEFSDGNSCPEVVTRTYQVADLCGNTATCTQTITIDDDIDPVLTCPGPLTAVCSIAEQPAYATLAAFETAGGTATDNCGIDAGSFTLISEFSDGNSCPEVITRTYQVADLCGNTATCNQRITIDDDIDPTIICPNNVEIASDPGVCYATNPDLGTPITDDNCGVQSVSNNLLVLFPSGEVPVGVHTITWTVTDVCGNTATCDQLLTVEDNENPVITCPGNIVEYTPGGSCHKNLVPPEPTIVENCSVASLDWALTGATTGSGSGYIPNTTFYAGITYILYVVEDASGNTDSCEFTVTILDNLPPVVTCPVPAASYPADPGFCYATLSFEATATDNCAVDYVKYFISGPEVFFPYDFAVGTTTVEVVAADFSGNTDTCYFDVQVMDTQPPNFSFCPTNKISSTDPDLCSYMHTDDLWDAVATDNCSVISSLTYSLTGATTGTGVTLNGQVFEKGITTVTWTAVDAYGNSDICDFLVTVSDNQNPTVQCPVPNFFNRDTDLDSCYYIVVGDEFDLLGYNDNCPGPYTVSYQLSGATTGTGLNTLAGILLNIGITSIRWTVTDESGNINNSCVISVQVIDNVPPVFLNCDPYIIVPCPDDIPLPDPDAMIAIDNCTPDITVTHIEPDIWFGVGNEPGFCPDSIIRRYKATDASGNSDTCFQTIIPEDDCGCQICQDTVPHFWVDLTDKCDSIWVQPPPYDRNGLCCDATSPARCISFSVRIGPGAVGFWVDCTSPPCPPGWFFQVDCGPQEPIGSYMCVPPGEYHTVTICKAGGDQMGVTITSICGILVADDIETRVSCESEVVVEGAPETTIVWSNITGDYLQYLSGSPGIWTPPDGNDTVYFTPDSLAPPVIQYQVCAEIPDNPCIPGGIACDTVTLMIYPEVEISLDPPYQVFCHNDPKPVTATATPPGSYGIEWYDLDNNLLQVGGVFLPPDSGFYYVTMVDTTTTLPCSSDTLFFQVEYVDCIVCPPPQYHCDSSEITEYKTIVSFVDAGGDISGFPCTPSNIQMVEQYSDHEECIETVVHIYRIQDDCGNVDSCDHLIYLGPYDDPVAPPDDSSYVQCLSQGGPPDLPSVYDVCGTELEGVLESMVETEDTASCLVTRKYTYSFSDCDSNMAWWSHTYFIEDTIPPDITCPGETPFEVIVNSGATYIHSGTSWDATATDNCGIDSLTWQLTGDTEATGEISLDGVIFNRGTTTVTWTATDICGNTASCAYQVIVYPDPPLIVCPPDTTVYTEPGLCSATFDPGSPILIDGLEPIDWEWIIIHPPDTSYGTGDSIDPIPTFVPDTTWIVWIATNISGADTCTQMIIVIDNEPPTFENQGPFEFCVYNIFTAIYNGLPEPDADIIPDRPDWYIIDGTTELDILVMDDNCCEDSTMTLYWTINFSNGYAPINGSGQPSEYGEIKLWGTTDYTVVVHTITYLLEDCHGNVSDPVTVDITMIPRPNVIKAN